MIWIWAKRPGGNSDALHRFRSSCAAALCICPWLMYFTVSNHSISRQRKPWSDCKYAQAVVGIWSPLMLEESFSHGITQMIFEPAHDKTNNTICVNSKDSDQPVHSPSMARVLLYTSFNIQEAVEGTFDQQMLWSDCVWMHRLIWVFAGCTSRIVGFVMHWFICYVSHKTIVSISMKRSFVMFPIKRVLVFQSNCQRRQSVLILKA